MSGDMLNIAVLGSGRGSNFQAILTAIQQGRITGAEIRVVISNNSGAGILEIARNNSLPAVHLSHRQFTTEDEFVDALLSLLSAHRVNFIVLAGYMKRVHPRVVEAYRRRIINIHPALLPRFGGPGMYGIRVHEAVIASGERLSGATVHFVDEEYDHGSVVLQKTVLVAPDDTPETLAARVLEIEHEIYPEAIRRLAHQDAVVEKA
ncbi:MAG: phosphoribosylglycinamide formyltransferase [Bacteroidetes bacterium]|jgi:phosphoribosylglycinamide formyltransferase-1|nr:phosphoribosylglycinamide formyltransferase [Bacteroidota bacterium]